MDQFLKMKKGFELLKTKDYTDIISIESLEKKYGITIPNLYRVFAQTFVLGENCISSDLFYHPKFNDNRYVSYFGYTKKPEIEFSGFNTIENSILFSIEIENKDDIEYLAIGYNTIGGISIGIKGDKKDVVFLYTPDGYPEEYTKLCDNIFEFMKGLEEIVQPEEYLDGVKYSQLYKNWGDDIWRVREK